MNLNLILGDKFGNMVPVYTFQKNIIKYIDNTKDNYKISTVKITTNNKIIEFYKLYINVNFSLLAQLTQNKKINQLNIICMGEVYKLLKGTNKTDYKEPNLEKKMNIFNLFYVMPFTTTNVEVLLMLFSEKFLNYRINYMYKNVPITLLDTNKHSNILNDLLNKHYGINMFSMNPQFKSNKKYLCLLRYDNIIDKLLKELYIPKLSNMNNFKRNFELTEEKIKFNHNILLQLDFFIKTFDGVFLVKDIKFKDANNDYINEKLFLLKKLIITNQEEGKCSFSLYKYIIENYKSYIEHLEITETFFSSKIDVLNQYLKKETLFFQYNFLLELSKNNIYKTILNQYFNIVMFDILKEYDIEDYGILLSKQMTYIDFDNIKNKLIDYKEEDVIQPIKNNYLTFVVPNEL